MVISFLFYLAFCFFSQLFARPLQTIILPFCIFLGMVLIRASCIMLWKAHRVILLFFLNIRAILLFFKHHAKRELLVFDIKWSLQTHLHCHLLFCFILNSLWLIYFWHCLECLLFDDYGCYEEHVWEKIHCICNTI